MTRGCLRVHPWLAPDFTECLISTDTMSPDESPSLVYGVVGSKSRGEETMGEELASDFGIYMAILGSPICILFSCIF